MYIHLMLFNKLYINTNVISSNKNTLFSYIYKTYLFWLDIHKLTWGIAIINSGVLELGKSVHLSRV